VTKAPPLLVPLQPNITTSCFNLLNCLPYKIGGVQYLASDLSVSCDAAAHKALSVFAMLLIVGLGLGLPVAFALYIHRQRERLDDAVLRRRFSDLYTPYKPEFCFWESLVFVRTATVVAIGSLVTGDSYMQSFSGEQRAAADLTLTSDCICQPKKLPALALYCASLQPFYYSSSAWCCNPSIRHTSTAS